VTSPVNFALALLAVAAADGLRAQSAEPRLVFEVASVKPSDEASKKPMGWQYDDARVSYTRANLKVLVMDAYNVQYYQLDAPSWFETQHYDVSAKIPDGASQDQVAPMLQTLLTERFRMTLHRETRNEPAFALVVGKSGPKLRNSVETGEPAVTVNDGHFEWRRATMAWFAQRLSGLTGRPVVDMTGLSGKFDITLELTPSELAGLRSAATAVESQEGTSIFEALRAIGLKLEARRMPIDHLVIDSALRVPTEN